MDKPIYCAAILKNLLRRVSESEARLEARLSQSPEGSIKERLQEGKIRFYKHLKGGPDEYLGKGKEQEIDALIQKKLDNELLKITQNEKRVLEKALKDLGTKTREQVWAQFPEVYKNKIKVVDEGLIVGGIKKWQNSYPLCKKDDEHKFLTSRGDYVRSKSEYLIADRLYRANIPYHYEKSIAIHHAVFQPDFIVLHPKTLKEYYWEHFGMMDKESYFEKTKLKLELYAEAGILPTKNLILTFETAKSPLDLEYVDLLIKKILKE